MVAGKSRVDKGQDHNNTWFLSHLCDRKNVRMDSFPQEAFRPQQLLRPGVPDSEPPPRLNDS